MKKGVLFFSLVLALVLFTYLFLFFTDVKLFQKQDEVKTDDVLTGITITGETTSGETSVLINIIGPPTLTLIRPKNRTYFTGENLDLLFTAVSADNIWYNIDSKENITVTESIEFNTTEGQHTLYLFANNTHGESSRNVTFFVNPSVFSVIYDSFKDSKTRGGSTNLEKYPYEEIQNLSEIILENTDYGKITFNEPINLTAHAGPVSNILDIDSNVNVSFNMIEINTTALLNFNKSATLSLYNLTFTNPRILRNGGVCPESICTIINYSKGTLIFNVTQFTAYSAEETPDDVDQPTPSRGGGAASLSVPSKPFTIDKDQISLKLRQGEVRTKDITITNILNRHINVVVSSERLEEFIFIKDSQFSLGPGESKTITIDVIVREDVVPEMYLGKIIISSENFEENILTLIEVQSFGVLLDIYLDIDPRSRIILPGEELLAQLTIFNLGASRRADINIEYQVRDENNGIILKEHETLAIETQLSLTKRMHIPEYVKPGRYILYVRADFNGEIASATSRFEVVKDKIGYGGKIYRGLVVILIIMIGFIIYYIIRKKRINK